LTLSIEFDII